MSIHFPVLVVSYHTQALKVCTLSVLESKPTYPSLFPGYSVPGTGIKGAVYPFCTPQLLESHARKEGEQYAWVDSLQSAGKLWDRPCEVVYIKDENQVYVQ
jgi:hypothetical protein